MKTKFISLGFLIILGIAFLLILQRNKIQTEFKTTLAPFYQMLGKPVMMASQSMTKILSINDLDEKNIGLQLKDNYISYVDQNDETYKYLNLLMRDLSKFKTKNFDYEIYILDSRSPNAFALPGGIIFVTSGLMNILKSESELVSVLLHEMGHVEKNHCIEFVRFQLTAQKIGATTLGSLSDMVYNIALKHSYSKTQEDEADSFAFRSLLKTTYDIFGASKAFGRLESEPIDQEKRKAHILLEYFQSHPHITLRREKYFQKAKNESKSSQNKINCTGVTNFQKRIPMSVKIFAEDNNDGLYKK